jgi:tRNA (guanine37-N1)-methyltransferase
MSKTSFGVRVCKTHAQKTITSASKLSLFNTQLEVKRNKDFVYVPLARQPSEPELEELRRQVTELRVSTYVFQERAKRASASLADMLKGRLDPNLMAQLPHSSDIVGNIAIVEIPQELRPYRAIIGDAILKRNKNVRTVLAKEGEISGAYRLRKLKVIAGKSDMTTVHREYGCRYYLDVAKAYFSPRLSHEHHRVARLVREGENVLDMFAGVGSFAVQIAKSLKNIKVYAVDANPYAVEFLRKNIRLNRVEAKVVPILGDAEEVVKHRLSGTVNRVIMNLPEKATQFMCAACSALRASGGTIHFYGFVKAPKTLESAQSDFVRGVEQCGRRVERIPYSRPVRATAPYEWQFVIDAQIS